MAAVERAAKFFVMLANRQDDDFITNLKLNKLLYYAQGAFLARTGKPLFDEKIEAWKYGPVVPSVYERYKVCGHAPIQLGEGEEVEASDFTVEELDALLDTAREFGKYTGSTLVDMTHAPDSPWSKAYTGDYHVEIPREEMRAYFVKHPVPVFEPGENCQQADAFPKDWYDPEEDAEWEDYL